jgi:hypothetical protein
MLYIEVNHIPVVRFRKGDRKLDVKALVQL